MISEKELSSYRLTSMEEPTDEMLAQIMVSVPKKCFKRAVKRNRVKRQIREAYRLNKAIVTEQMKKHESKYLTMAFIWLDAELHDTDEIKTKMINLLGRISERL